MMQLISIALAVIAIPAVLSCTYLLIATLLSRSLTPPALNARNLRFDVVIPAHNEAAGITRAIRSALSIDWPREAFRVLVVADNCTDRTAAIAESAGAVVLERTHALERGKGYALAHAFAASRADGFADAVVVVDADSDVSPNILEAFARRIGNGLMAAQAHYGVRNPDASWRTRLITIAHGSFHIVRSRARERLGLSCGLRGNGWCVTHALLERIPYNAYSPTEDIEFGISLGLSGIRIGYADEAHADADMESDHQRATSQRARWEQGRLLMIRTKVRPLLMQALRQRSAVCLDLALDLLVLPLSYVAALSLALGAAAAIASAVWPAMYGWLWLAGYCGLSLLVYVLRGWQLSGTGVAGLKALLSAPWFLAWKFAAAIRSRGQTGWVRTKRDNE